MKILKISILMLSIITFIDAVDIKYGKLDNEIEIGEMLRQTINVENKHIFVPWCAEIKNDEYKWIKCKIEFERLITIRVAPNTHNVIIAKSINVVNNEKLFWVYLDNCTDGTMYRKLNLENGSYEIAIKDDGGKKYIGSIKKTAQQGDAPEPASPAR